MIKFEDFFLLDAITLKWYLIIEILIIHWHRFSMKHKLCISGDFFHLKGYYVILALNVKELKLIMAVIFENK